MWIKRQTDSRNGARLEVHSGDEPVTTETTYHEVAAPAVESCNASLEDLYHAHGSHAFGLAVRLLQDDRETAETIVAESVVELWRSFSAESEVDDAGRRYALLRRVHARCLQAKQSRAEGTDITFPLDGCVTPDGVPGKQVSQPTTNSVREAVTALSGYERTSIDLAFFEGWSSIQIAVETGIPRPEVHGAMRRGLRSLHCSIIESNRGDAS